MEVGAVTNGHPISNRRTMNERIVRFEPPSDEKSVVQLNIAYGSGILACEERCRTI
jgi:hypothetical protein